MLFICANTPSCKAALIDTCRRANPVVERPLASSNAGGGPGRGMPLIVVGDAYGSGEPPTWLASPDGGVLRIGLQSLHAGSIPARASTHLPGSRSLHWLGLNGAGLRVLQTRTRTQRLLGAQNHPPICPPVSGLKFAMHGFENPR